MDQKKLKTTFITGGGQGIGKGLALRFLQAGYKVTIAEIDEEAGHETAEEYDHEGEILFIHTDVSDEASVKNAVEDAVNQFGRLDVLINNAGHADPFNKPVENLELDNWQRIIGTNLTGAFLSAKHAVPELRKSGNGCIINIASTRAFQSEPHSEAYAATKGGLIALTHALAVSLGPAIRVNSISPGWIAVEEWQKKDNRHKPDLRQVDHEQHPAGRVGTPHDIASLALWLASDEAGFVTGQNFISDGGMTRKMIYEE